jgi:dTDP-4-amino-4,6-dideoxygalactose transaminase
MANNVQIPFLDLISLHEQLESELVPVFQKLLQTAQFVGGPMVEGFEREFASSCAATHSAGVGSGTDAVRFALMAAGIRSGELVITVPNTFIATVEGISQAGAEPRFIDVDDHTYNIDASKVRRYLEHSCSFDDRLGVAIENASRKPVTAIVPVHLYGQMADMDALVAIAEQYNLILIEDACQAHGAQYFSEKVGRWRTAGSIGKAAAFSFYPGKNLGACGEAGAVVTNDPELDYRVRVLRDHGQIQKYYHEIEGYNGRLDAIQAGILQVKLRHLSKWTELRRDAAAHYRELLGTLAGNYIGLPDEPEWTKCVYHLFVIRASNRDGLIKHLAGKGIGTGIHYPVPLHLQNAYANLGYRSGDFPVAEALAREIVSLPMYPQLTVDQRIRVASEVVEFVTSQKPLLARVKIA